MNGGPAGLGVPPLSLSYPHPDSALAGAFVDGQCPVLYNSGRPHQAPDVSVVFPVPYFHWEPETGVGASVH